LIDGVSLDSLGCAGLELKMMDIQPRTASGMKDTSNGTLNLISLLNT
jgi:hypothetical protein